MASSEKNSCGGERADADRQTHLSQLHHRVSTVARAVSTCLCTGVGAGGTERTSSASHLPCADHRCAWRAEIKLGPGTKVPPTDNTVWGRFLQPPVRGHSLLYVVVLDATYSLSYAGLSSVSWFDEFGWVLDDCFSWICSLLLGDGLSLAIVSSARQRHLKWGNACIWPRGLEEGLEVSNLYMVLTACSPWSNFV